MELPALLALELLLLNVDCCEPDAWLCSTDLARVETGGLSVPAASRTFGGREPVVMRAVLRLVAVEPEPDRTGVIARAGATARSDVSPSTVAEAGVAGTRGSRWSLGIHP